MKLFKKILSLALACYLVLSMIPIDAVAADKSTYTISFNSNGGTYSPEAQIKTHGVDLVLTRDIPVKEGRTFRGWDTSSVAANVRYRPGDTFTIDADTTLYAVWHLNYYEVSFKANGGESAPKSQLKNYGMDLTLTDAIPTRAGYTFLGWDTSSKGTTVVYKPGEVYTENAKLTLYAVWEPIYVTVTFSANGATNVPDAITKQHSVDIVLPDTVPVKEGRTFLGWDTSSVSAYIKYKPGDTFALNEDTTLYAVWKLNSYTVSYNANGGEGAPQSQLKNHGMDLTLRETVPTRDGYTFLGWDTSSKATTVVYAPGDTFTENAKTTLYAVWLKDGEILRGDIDGDGEISPLDYFQMKLMLAQKLDASVEQKIAANADGSESFEPDMLDSFAFKFYLTKGYWPA